MKQYNVKLPITAYVLRIYHQGKPIGYWPLTSNHPWTFGSRKAAMETKLPHEKIERVKIIPQ